LYIISVNFHITSANVPIFVANNDFSTNYTKQSSTSGADSHSAGQEIPAFYGDGRLIVVLVPVRHSPDHEPLQSSSQLHNLFLYYLFI